MNQRLLIVAASARPLILSSRVAGFDVAAFDFFADWDSRVMLEAGEFSEFGESVQQTCSLERISGFEKMFDPSHASEIASCDAAIVCGGFESRQDLVGALAEQITVLGPEAKQLGRLRNAPAVFEFLRQIGVSIPDTKLILDQNDDPDRWLRKTCGTAGGNGVRVACAEDIGVSSPNVFFQSWIGGTPVSAVLVSSRDQNGVIQSSLLGVTQQLIGEDYLGAIGFQYCGSIGSHQLPVSSSLQIEFIASGLAREYEILGLWGVDFIVTEKEVMPVDINPRMTASMELFESAFGRADSGVKSMVDLHVSACCGQMGETELAKLKTAIAAADWPTEGKAILFHREQAPLRISSPIFAALKNKFRSRFFVSNDHGFSIADVPNRGQIIKAREPILSLRVRMKTDLVSPRIREEVAGIVQLLRRGNR